MLSTIQEIPIQDPWVSCLQLFCPKDVTQVLYSTWHCSGLDLSLSWNDMLIRSTECFANNKLTMLWNILPIVRT